MSWNDSCHMSLFIHLMCSRQEEPQDQRGRVGKEEDSYVGISDDDIPTDTVDNI